MTPRGWFWSVGLGFLLSYYACGCSFDGLDQFVAVPDFEDLGEDVDVDTAAFAVAADGDLLPGHGDDAVDGDLTGDPLVGVAGVVEGDEMRIELGRGPVLGDEEPLGGVAMPMPRWGRLVL